jgi:hypothetical protein
MENEIKHMIREISAKSELKKSPVMARSLAKDYEILSGSEAVAQEGQMGRIGRNGKATPGQFIRAITYKVKWYEFISFEEAMSFQKMLNSSVSKQDHSRKLTEHTRDYGILEMLDLLLEKNSELLHTKEAYRILSLGLRYNV